MSDTRITIERVNEVEHHPDADRLDIIQVLGYKVICGRGQFKAGDAVVYFPPDILIPEKVSRELGVQKYLKHAVYPGDEIKTQCRVAAARLRGVPSHGFVIALTDTSPGFGHDVTDTFEGSKYEPPKRENAGNVENEDSRFHRYTSIENFQRFPNLLEPGEEVVITEKIHGTNCRMGKIGGEYMAGSHKVQRKSGEGLYWQFFDAVKPLLDTVGNNVIIFGEIFGPGVQDLDYGLSVKSFQAFDIMVDGKYMDYPLFKSLCENHNVKTVPELYKGPFDMEIVEKCTYGRTTFKGVKAKFKDREGCVVRPLLERNATRFGRVILKSVSADYRNRKGAIDVE